MPWSADRGRAPLTDRDRRAGVIQDGSAGPSAPECVLLPVQRSVAAPSLPRLQLGVATGAVGSFADARTARVK